MASEDPANMFADMKKKKKKPKVAFAEDPASADADPTYPPKEPIDDPSLGPATAHERALKSGPDADAGGDELGGGEDANMFGDLKKKKKKKEVIVDEEEVGAESLDFSDLKKKKKKKEVSLDLEETPAGGDETPLEDFSDLKKKKKKKDIPLDLEEGAAPADGISDLKKKKKKKDIPMDLEGAAEPAAEGGDDFSDLKKKKKKKALAMEDFEKEFDDAPVASNAPSKKKTKKIDKSDESDNEAEGGDEGEFDEVNEVDEEELGENPFAAGGSRDVDAEAWLGSDRDYTYEELLSRFFRLLHASNPSLASSSSKRYTLAPPSIHRDGNKKSVFANIGDICRRMHREPTHVISFLLVEMGTTGSVDGSGRLVIKGKFQQKQIENILRRYIMEYVTCKTCKSPDTLLTKETRISFITCESCGSRQSVSAIKAGFQAQVGKRKKQQV